MSKSFQYKHIIWDWNGTLLNDGWLFVDVMNSILRQRKMETITLDKYRNIFGFPIKDYYIKLGFDLDKEPLEKSGMEFIREYKNRRYEAKLFPKVITLLTKLKATGISHSILSAQHQTLLDDLTQFYNIRHYFIKVIGLNDYYAHSKIKNGIIWIRKLNINLDEILMIGDTNHDFEAAQAMGIDCILLSQGHHCSAILEKTGGTVFLDIKDIFNFFKLRLME